MSDALESLLQNPRVWRGIQPACRDEEHPTTHPTGYARLDRHLPGGGWPRHALTEILLEHYGTGELELLMPALARLCSAGDSGLQDSDAWEAREARETRETGWIVWIAPPFQPYPPALLQWGIDLQQVLIVHPGKSLEALWAAEQALSCGNCAAVLLWSDVLDLKTSRRLQLAAEKGRSWAIAFRPLKALTQSSAAALRIELSTGEQGTDVRILKSRGGRPVNVSGVLRNDPDYDPD